MRGTPTLFGSPEVHVAIPDDALVEDLIAALRGIPGGALLPSHPLVAVNLTHAEPSTPVRAGDEVAVLPPLAGG